MKSFRHLAKVIQGLPEACFSVVCVGLRRADGTTQPDLLEIESGYQTTLRGGPAVLQYSWSQGGSRSRDILIPMAHRPTLQSSGQRWWTNFTRRSVKSVTRGNPSLSF